MTRRQLLPASTVARSRELRRAMGEPERRLWSALREAFAEQRWRRQVPLGRYHPDFCSHRARLIVEVDGDDHTAKAGRDAERTSFLERKGYRVLRFANGDVMANAEGVIATISTALRANDKRGHA